MRNGSFDQLFQALTDHAPFPWQRRLYEEWFRHGRIPATCSLPTGLGKTSVIAVWLIALAQGAKVPRRLVYVVNRRTVVDQTTDEAIKLRHNAPKIGIDNLAISTLRGQFADNRQWSADPSRPAVICGTVDMIGSRLLFSGYGVGFKARPLHAGFLGQDALLVHDEAHLEPAFQKLIESIRGEQARSRDFAALHVMELTATTRSGDEQASAAPFTLDEKDLKHPEVRQRVQARKQLSMSRVDDDKQVVATIAAIAAAYKEANVAVLVFVRTLDAVSAIEKELVKTKRPVVLLTGTMRGLERDALAERDPVFMRFLPEKSRNPEVKTAEGTVYLICTSAGEVGVDISADHMVCDLSTFESMAQRFGRVNRYGQRNDTRVDVVHPERFDEKDKLAPARQATLELLGKLEGDASPLELGALDRQERHAAFAPEPTILPATDILFDAWALTSIHQPMPGRPPVEPYLHGIAEWQAPETYVAWRSEVEIITGGLVEQHPPADLLDDYPLKPHELLRDRSDRVFKHVEALAMRFADKPVWIIDDRETVEVTTLAELADRQRRDRINGCTILFPPSAGGLAGGMLDGASDQADDVADITDGLDQRIRIHPNDSDYEAKVAKVADMRRARSIELGVGEDEDDEPRRWEWYESIPLEGRRTASKPVTWQTHVDDVVDNAKHIVAGLSLPQKIADVITLAAELHDYGKRRQRFQITLGNRSYPRVLWAKSGKNGARLPEPFRHEFASVLDAQTDETFKKLDDEMKDLVLHLIAAHHGRARPHFDVDEAFDPDPPEGRSTAAEALAMEIPRRFARLQRKYGRWGLAYLESLLRAADWAASAAPSAYADEPEATR